jgi:hypothetical protein
MAPVNKKQKTEKGGGDDDKVVASPFGTSCWMQLDALSLCNAYLCTGNAGCQFSLTKVWQEEDNNRDGDNRREVLQDDLPSAQSSWTLLEPGVKMGARLLV